MVADPGMLELFGSYVFSETHHGAEGVGKHDSRDRDRLELREG